LAFDVPPINGSKLTFPDHRHRLKTRQRSPRRPETAEAKSRSDQALDTPVILLNDVIQIFALPQTRAADLKRVPQATVLVHQQDWFALRARSRRLSSIRAENLRGRGDTVPEELLAHVSPMGWTHVGLTGDYLWERTDDIAPGSYRPLNDPGARLRSAA